ncbi:PREDICTED: protein sprint isoform X1 [Drosophila arizonae]|uniref:Protein sprint isoform X1 n=1 Tax=Drosophila arizonae TaxID=7263 RepID=A0ABM1PB42_DROAR|nr:PREDICTED: protein sprint isoform X1 [Drosophila arizonae]XP_017864428.1 PREDICTED: protein sprint isoform X1 [Drosophila arizonae]
MITNNNLDYEKSCLPIAARPTATATATSVAGTAATIASGNSNSNGSASSSNNSSPTADNHNNTHSHSISNSNGSSYFNRFDNRIAANLAAVITGARFRSSSCNSRQQQTQPPSVHHTSRTSYHYLSASRGRSTLSNATPTSPASLGRRRPLQLFSQANLNCNDNEKGAHTPSSDEDNSPTELNSCKRLTDKPPLVKRLTMGLLRHNEESRPLVANVTPLSAAALGCEHAGQPIYSNGYINEDSYIDSKFGDSCRQSLTAIPMLDNVNLNNDNSEFNLKKRYLRETSSANSSPKIFANRLRFNNASATAAAAAAAAASLAATQRSSSLADTHTARDDEEEESDTELKAASWYQAGISRDIAVEVLQSKSPGAFLVRKSSSKPDCYALTLRVPSPPGPKVANYIILRSPRGYKIKGFRKEFSSLKALITHHSVMPELLPVPLAMPRPTNMSSSRRNLDDFDTYDSLQMLLKYLRAKNLETDQ